MVSISGCPNQSSSWSSLVIITSCTFRWNVQIGLRSSISSSKPFRGFPLKPLPKYLRKPYFLKSLLAVNVFLLSARLLFFKSLGINPQTSKVQNFEYVSVCSHTWHGSSQARSQIGAAAAELYYSQGNAGSEPHL